MLAFISASILKLLLVLLVIFSAVRSDRDEDKTTKVVGGRVARKNEVPYIVAIYGVTSIGKQQFCGGSIYNERFIITAAHCVANDNPADPPPLNIEIVAGTNDHTKTDNAQVIMVKQSIVHPKYGSFWNDIALLELEKDLQFNDAVQPIPIPPAGTAASGGAILSGWGATKIRKYGSSLGAFSDILMTVIIGIIPREACDKYYHEISQEDVYENSNMHGKGVNTPAKTSICAGKLPPGGKDSCLGDSGGPLQCSRDVGGKPEKYLCGVVSSGYGCGLKIPGSYTDVAKFSKWIQEVAGPMGRKG